MCTFRKAVAAAALCLLPLIGQAAVVWDQSPATFTSQTLLNIGPWTGTVSNISDAENYGEFVRFSDAQAVTGMDIYTSASRNVAVGESVTLRVRAEWEESPLLYDFNATVRAVDQVGVDPKQSFSSLVRVYATFDEPVLLDAGTDYVVGMSGTTNDIGLAMFSSRGHSVMHYTDRDFMMAESSRETAFRLHVGAVPEPSTYALLIAGLGFVAFAARRRKQQ
jgi:PEP-CTERM motif